MVVCDILSSIGSAGAADAMVHSAVGDALFIGQVDSCAFVAVSPTGVDYLVGY